MKAYIAVWTVLIFSWPLFVNPGHTQVSDGNRPVLLAQAPKGAGGSEGKVPDEQQRTRSRVWPYFGEDSTKTEVAEDLTAKNFILVFDGSGSMTEKKCSGNRTKIQVAKEAVMEWIKTVPTAANVGLVAFHGNTFTRIPLASGDRKDLIKAVMAIDAGGGTPLTEAFGHAYAMLTTQGRKQLGYGEYTIVVVTDGIANNPTTLAGRVRAILDYTPMLVHTIGFCIEERHTLNQPGRAVYRTADNPEDLRKGLQEVLAEADHFDITDFRK